MCNKRWNLQAEHLINIFFPVLCDDVSLVRRQIEELKLIVLCRIQIFMAHLW
jgi:hypothetical protein